MEVGTSVNSFSNMIALAGQDEAQAWHCLQYASAPKSTGLSAINGRSVNTLQIR